jgi:hypothetical protein
LEVSELVLHEVWANILSTYNDGGDISEKLADYAKESTNREHHITENTLV